jgi:Uma2 family endonuclease
MPLTLKLRERSVQQVLNRRRWEELIERGDWGIPEIHRVETDRHGRLVVHEPLTAQHGTFQSEVVKRLHQRIPGGRAVTVCPVSTSDGVKILDVGWMSRERYEPMRDCVIFDMAPEICIEILSSSNTDAEMEEKRDLYFEIGCLEFWTVGATGKVRFFGAGGVELENSNMCPAFPGQIEL